LLLKFIVERKRKFSFFTEIFATKQGELKKSTGSKKVYQLPQNVSILTTLLLIKAYYIYQPHIVYRKAAPGDSIK